MEKAKEIGDNVFTKATEGADNLKQKLAEIKPSEGLSDHELKQGIEQMETAIKDYSPTPIKDINDALYRQDGLLRPLVERYDELKKKVEELKGAFDEIEKRNVGDAVQNAINDTNGGLFNDDINENAKDYAEALKKQDDAIRKFASQYPQYIRKAASDATNASEDFKKATSSMTTDVQKITYLIKNLDKYKDLEDIPSVSNVLNGKVGANRLGGGFGIDRARQNLVEDMQAFWDSIETDAAQNGITSIKNATDAVKEGYAIAIKNWIQGLEVTDEVKQMMFNFYSELLGFDFETFDAQQTIINGLDEGLEAEIGKALFQKIKNGVKLTPDEQAQIEKAVEKLYTDIYKKTPDAQKAALNKAVASEDGKGGWVFDSGKIMRIVARMSVRADWDEWQREIDDATGNLKPIQTWIKGATDIPSFIKAAQEGYADAQKTIDKFKGLKLSASIGFDFKELKAIPLVSKQFADASPLAKKMIVEWNNAVDTIKAAQTAGKELGFDPAGSDKKKNSGSKKGTHTDKVAEDLKQRFKDIKDAYAMFKEWAKLEGKDAAFTRVGNSGLFATLAPDKVPQTVDEYLALIDELEKDLKAAGIKGHNQRETLANDLIKERFGINKDTFKEELQLALDKVTKEAERQLADWNLYDKVRKATGNKQLAKSIAFGMNADATTDYPTLVRKQFNDLAKELGHDITFDNTTLEQAKKLGDDIAKSYQDTASKLEKYAREQKDAIADILNEYQSLQDKLRKIDTDRDRKIDTVNESDMPDADKAKYIQRINVEADYQKFTQSNEYLQFFAGIYALTQQEATRIGDLIEQNLNRRLQAGTSSAEDYYKEIERVRQQLSKLRNVKSDAMTFMTGGVKGLNQKKQEENDAKRLETIQKIKDLEEKLAEQKAAVKGIDDVNGYKAVLQTEAQLMTAKKELSIQDKIREKLIQNQQTWQDTADVANIAANIAQGISDAFYAIKDIAASFGVDTESGAWLNVGAVVDTLTAVTDGISNIIGSLLKGDIGGAVGGVFKTIATPFTIWSELHDKKLDKMIERSKEAAQIMQNQYDILEKRMANWLGNAAAMNTGILGGGYGKQRDLMKGQLAELQKQRQAEMDKKKVDDEAVADYYKQIEEMKISIRDFALEAAKDLYSIDLNGWAEQLGDSLVDAFAAGEDAAEAFDKTVGDIMRDITKKMISQDILAPMFGDLRDYLFGENGQSGAFGADFELTPDEVAKIKEYMDRIKNKGIPAAQELYDAINEATGGILDDASVKSGLSAGIQSVTEDTADLLASYLNSVRASTSMIEQYELASNEYSRMISEVALPRLTTISESQLRTQEQIAANTLLNAKMATEIRDILKRNINGGGNFRIS